MLSSYDLLKYILGATSDPKKHVKKLGNISQLKGSHPGLFGFILIIIKETVRKSPP